MADIFLLDCSLRDGGYVNDWKFGQDNLISIFERLVDSNVDIIEIGFLDERRPFDIDRSIMPDTKCVDKIYNCVAGRPAMVVGMIDYGTCGIENVEPCGKSFLNGIRVIFKKHLMHDAMQFCGKLKAMGYKVFSQLVSITSYSDEELMELIGLVNEVKPYAVSMVDTYGLLHPDELLHYYEILDKYVDTKVKIGFHAHNNFQLAYANSLTFLEKETRHDIIVDGTLYGIGKGAGNAPLELLAMRLNEKWEKHYNVDAMLESINESIMDIYLTTPWGYKPFFYLSARNRCHPNYVTFFNSKMNFSASKVDLLLAGIEPEEKKLLYDKLVAEHIYEEYVLSCEKHKFDKEKLKTEFCDRKLLVMGPGKNIKLQKTMVDLFVKKHNPYVISINYIPEEFQPDCVFITNGKRYHDMAVKLKQATHNIKLLATSNVECRRGKFDFCVERVSLLEKNERIVDNSLLMLLKLLDEIGQDEIYLAGFDGYSDKEENYCNPMMEYNFVRQESPYLNRHMKEAIITFKKSMKINFITYSAYDEEEDINHAYI